MLAPAVVLLLVWMIVPLAMTIYFSLLHYQLLDSDRTYFVGLDNYQFFVTSLGFLTAIANTVILVASVLVLTIAGGLGFALLLNQPIWGRGFVRILAIAPFFVMPTVSALIFKNMFMNPISGIFAHLAILIGIEPIDFLGLYPLQSIILIVSWQWLPFALLILLTALQSLDQEQMEAATMDGAGALTRFYYIVLPHLWRPLVVVLLTETIYLLSVFAEILVTTNGGPGHGSTNLTYLIYARSLLQFDVGGGSAGGIIAVILANIVAFFLMRMVGKNLE
ncbi:MAG: sugar ABC transporter permease [Candidatus Pacebacteria bacterium]|nr:sugar ABC transporter permease [Candidatus Paceibacterota bacterium]